MINMTNLKKIKTFNTVEEVKKFVLELEKEFKMTNYIMLGRSTYELPSYKTISGNTELLFLNEVIGGIN